MGTIVRTSNIAICRYSGSSHPLHNDCRDRESQDTSNTLVVSVRPAPQIYYPNIKVPFDMFPKWDHFVEFLSSVPSWLLIRHYTCIIGCCWPGATNTENSALSDVSSHRPCWIIITVVTVQERVGRPYYIPVSYTHDNPQHQDSNTFLQPSQ